MLPIVLDRKKKDGIEEYKSQTSGMRARYKPSWWEQRNLAGGHLPCQKAVNYFEKSAFDLDQIFQSSNFSF